jgi:hypothetical protein
VVPRDHPVRSVPSADGAETAPPQTLETGTPTTNKPVLAVIGWSRSPARFGKAAKTSWTTGRPPTGAEALRVIALTHRLTRLATTKWVLRPLRNLRLRLFAHVPAFRRGFAAQLSATGTRRHERVEDARTQPRKEIHREHTADRFARGLEGCP